MQDASKTLAKRSKAFKDASKTPQDTLTSAPRLAKDASKAFQDTAHTPQYNNVRGITNGSPLLGSTYLSTLGDLQHQQQQQQQQQEQEQEHRFPI